MYCTSESGVVRAGTVFKVVIEQHMLAGDLHDRELIIIYLGVSFFGYVVAEVTRGYLLEEDEQRLLSEKQRRVSRFMNTPREVEKVCL